MSKDNAFAYSRDCGEFMDTEFNLIVLVCEVRDD